MSFRWLRVLGQRGVLGMNKRNAHYIMSWNPRNAYPKVDDKALTKELASRHGIPTPRTFHVLAHHGEIRHLAQRLGSLEEFVIKPARGAGGSGILLVAGRSPGGFLKASGEPLSVEALRYHISEILSGIHSLEGREDRALVESMVHPHEVFESVSYRGVPDVRVIVYRGVPAMAMVRLPTKVSDGKANLHRGAIGAGIVISTGRTLPAVQGNSIVTTHPDTSHPVAGIQIPGWEQMLSMASRASEMTGLGYLGADLVLDRDLGPLLLELNARPGLAIQLANGSGLAARLQRIDARWKEIGPTFQERVAWAMEQFQG
jgi:alpha-L-glutamate ligase-like protein